MLEFRDRYDDRDLISATHVCEQWRSVLLSTPMLWAEVVFGDPNRALVYLERSKGAPLQVSIGESAYDSFTGSTSWIGRTDSLAINAYQDQMESVAGRLCLPAPLLRSLTFNGPPQSPGPGSANRPVHIPPGFLGQRAPCLQYLSFISVSPSPLINLPLSNLTNLRWSEAFAVIGDIFALLASAPLLEFVVLDFRATSILETEPLKVITLSKLQTLFWVNFWGLFSPMPFLIAPELDHLDIRMSYDPTHNDPSTILSPHGGHLPLLIEPITLAYLCRNFTRTWDFTYPSGRLTIYEASRLFLRDPPADRWLSTDAPISFGKVKEMIVEGFDGLPLPDHIPIEQFDGLENLKLVGEVDRLVHIIRPNRKTVSGDPSMPLLNCLELHSTLHEAEFPFKLLTELLREREEVGRGVKTIRITGEYRRCSKEELSELTRSVDVLVLD